MPRDDAPSAERPPRTYRWLMIVGIAFGGLLSLATAGAFGLALATLRAYTLPSSSMEPTLKIDGYAIALCYDVGCRFKNAPSTPRWSLGEPQLGDIATFLKPSDPSVEFVKRIVGMPGDRIEMREGTLYINDKPVPKIPAPDYVERGYDGISHKVSQFEETLPNGVRYHVLDREPAATLDTTPVFAVPAEHYFVLGDNRDNSSDSRDINGGIGFVPRENMIARVRWTPFSAQ